MKQPQLSEDYWYEEQASSLICSVSRLEGVGQLLAGFFLSTQSLYLTSSSFLKAYGSQDIHISS